MDVSPDVFPDADFGTSPSLPPLLRMADMTRPRLLDLFCCEGGASRGYADAGFEVIGVDIEPQPRYPFEFIQADAVEYLATADLTGFDAIAASPPCPAYANVTLWRGDQSKHPDLLPPVLALLEAQRLPWIVENVENAPLRPDFILCGSQFGLRIRRHRWFQTSWYGYGLLPPCAHRSDDLPFMHKGERAYADALGCKWMTSRGGRQAIPPAYTHYLGQQLLTHIAAERVA